MPSTGADEPRRAAPLDAVDPPSVQQARWVAARHAAGDHGVAGRASALLPPCFFAPAVAFFVAALLFLPAVAGQLRQHFYHTRVLAVTHAITLGWISMVMLGVLYRYVPAVAKLPLPYPRIAIVQCATFMIGVVGLITSFWIGWWAPTTMAAGVLLISVALLCVNMWPLAMKAPNHGVAERGVLLATGFLFVAAALGTTLAADKQYPLLGGNLVTNLGAHVHLAAVGWVGITICALSLRFLPAFLLPTVQFSAAPRRQITALAVAVVVLAGTLLARSPMALAAALAVAAALIVYLVLLARVVTSRRMPIDWTARHALAGVVWLVAATTAGVTLAFIGADTPLGVRLATAYGIAAILGWMSNLVIGVSYKLFPGFVAGARSERQRRAVPVAELSVPARWQAAVWILFNLGLIASAAGVLLDGGGIVTTGTLALAAAALIYGAVTARTLAYTLVDPPVSTDPLRIIP